MRTMQRTSAKTVSALLCGVPCAPATVQAVGMSLMDFGVGGIVMAGGLVGPLARAPGCHSTEQRVGIL